MKSTFLQRLKTEKQKSELLFYFWEIVLLK